jgi:hypothetical protein
VDQRGLVERAQQGDHDAFAVLANAAIARLDAAARLILRERHVTRPRRRITSVAISPVWCLLPCEEHPPSPSSRHHDHRS